MKLKTLVLSLCSASALAFAAHAETITIATVNNGDMIRMQKLTDDFTSKNPDIELEWVTLEENVLRQRVTTDIATGGGQFDVMTIGTYEVPIWAEHDWLVPLDDLGEDFARDDLLPAIGDSLSYDGKLYAAPFYAESALTMYRTDLFERDTNLSERAASADPRPRPRAHQSIPPALRRAVLARDQRRCRAPNCTHATFLDAHHVQPRAEGGREPRVGAHAGHDELRKTGEAGARPVRKPAGQGVDRDVAVVPRKPRHGKAGDHEQDVLGDLVHPGNRRGEEVAARHVHGHEDDREHDHRGRDGGERVLQPVQGPVHAPLSGAVSVRVSGASRAARGSL